MPCDGATTYYVAGTNGDDSADGTNWPTALRTISNAVLKAQAGDEVRLSTGEHFITDTFVHVKNDITIRGDTGNREDVIVNGNYPTTRNRCFYMTAGTIADLTITNGYGQTDATYITKWHYGGGVYMLGGTLRNCLITGNISSNRAGGVYMRADGALMTNCTLSGNYLVYSGEGGAVYMEKGRIVDCVISNNNTAGNGGGVYQMAGTIENSDLVWNTADKGAGLYQTGGLVTNCLIAFNSNVNGLYHGGGGVYMTAGTVAACRVIGNNAGANGPGGGISLRAGKGQMVHDCWIISNTAATFGGGVALHANTDGQVRNCLIAGNTATNGTGSGLGGGVYTEVITGAVVNCTIVDNKGDTGGGMYCKTSGNILNSVIYFNTVSSETSPNWFNNGSGMLYTNCCTTPLTGLPGSGNVEGDPRFADPAAGNYHLSAGSSCINAGFYQEWMATGRDLDGKPRLNAGFVDIGAYEYIASGTIIRIK